jgi:hypothetical protein
MATNVYLRAGAANPYNVILRDVTQADVEVVDIPERGQQPAGGGSRDRRRKQRKRYLIGERQYWADESELPGLILAVAAQPEKPPVTVARTRAKATKRAPEAAVQAPVVAVAAAAPASLQARLEALQAQFRAAENDILLRSLAIAAARLAEMENEDEELLLLAA